MADGADHAGGRRSFCVLVESVRSPSSRRTRPAAWSIHDGPARCWRRFLGPTIVLTFVADWLGFLDIDRTWLAGLVFLLGSVPLLWVDTVRPAHVLVYLGLAQLVAGTLDLASCAAGWNNAALLAGWLAVTRHSWAWRIWAAGTGIAATQAL